MDWLAYRLGQPALTEERCRSCRMLAGDDGITIESVAQARAFTAAMQAHPAAWSPRDMDGPIRAGDAVLLEPCVAADYAETSGTGRVCPRVELWPENDPAARLVFAVLPEHTRALMPAYAEALIADMEPEAARETIVRAIGALHGDAVTAWLRAQFAPKGGD